MTTAATDNIKAAATAADKLAEAIGGSGKVGVIVHDQTSRTGIDRRDGFINEMKAKYPNIKIIGPQYGAGDQLKSTDLAKAMIQANPDIKGFFGANEGSAIGVINAVKELKKDGAIKVVGYDSGKAQIDAINSGLMMGAITQNPVGIGEQCVDAAVKAIDGRDPAEDDRHRLLLVRQDQHQQPGDPGGPLPVGPQPERPTGNHWRGLSHTCGGPAFFVGRTLRGTPMDESLVEMTGITKDIPGRPRARRRDASSCDRARSTRSSARTAPASRR